jgi:hypothetical protein
LASPSHGVGAEFNQQSLTFSPTRQSFFDFQKQSFDLTFSPTLFDIYTNSHFDDITTSLWIKVPMLADLLMKCCNHIRGRLLGTRTYKSHHLVATIAQRVLIVSTTLQ